MDPILGGQVAAEVRTVEEAKPVRACPFRYNRARQEIRAACERLAKVKREARGKVPFVTRSRSLADTEFLARRTRLALEYRQESTADVRREEIAVELREGRAEARRLQHQQVYYPASVGAMLVLPALKAEIQSMQWAWAIARAIECDDGLNNSFNIQKIPLGNGKWARVKLPNRKSLRSEDAGMSQDIEDFRSWCGEITLADGTPDYDVSLGLVERYLNRWMIIGKAPTA